MTSGYEDRTGFVIVSFEFPLSEGQGKVPVTLGVNTIMYKFRMIGCYPIHATCRRTGGKETKAYPTIRTPIGIVNWGYPKGQRRKAIAAGLEYDPWVRSFRSSPRTGKPSAWRREAVVTRQN